MYFSSSEGGNYSSFPRTHRRYPLKTSISVYNTDLYPYNDRFVENPFDPENIVVTRRAGYAPIGNAEIIQIHNGNRCDESLFGDVYQLPCNTITPAGCCYRNNREIPYQP